MWLGTARLHLLLGKGYLEMLTCTLQFPYTRLGYRMCYDSLCSFNLDFGAEKLNLIQENYCIVVQV